MPLEAILSGVYDNYAKDDLLLECERVVRLPFSAYDEFYIVYLELIP
jgi:hypothetical protein